jgi:hypothetical protein
VDHVEIDDLAPGGLRVPSPVIHGRLGRWSFAVTGRYLRNIAPAEVITTMQ